MIREIKDIKIDPLKKQLEETQDYFRKKEINNEIEKIQKAKTISELGLTFDQAVKLLQEHDIPLILDEEDKAITERDGGFQGIEDFILVHLTEYEPTQNRIKSPKEAGAMLVETEKIQGKEYEYTIPCDRNTVHFCVNNEVNTKHRMAKCRWKTLCYTNTNGRYTKRKIKR